ncbi:hypothetical protein Rhopal_002842-T1 [Rhodotorula paludigena]|uniref:Uncharacterized protein n=1 Tax=Rhodotorula paludigena TaxID=86838 RepID=A0AAV5GHW9_9BASI|nr:hypothetical protein Rhopal_002842-T1 [Rhodotorula paludigena]
MPDTDYDSLPSPPRSTRGATAQGGTGKKVKLYGKRAARRGASAHASRAGGGAEREQGSSSDVERNARARKKIRDSAGKGRAKGAGRIGAARASKTRRVERDEEGDVESNGEDEDEETLRPAKPASTLARRDRLSAPKANKPPLSAPPPSTRANALFDKSNLTVESPRRAGLIDRSSSPFSPAPRTAADTSTTAQEQQPVFRYTTTEFGDLPSLRLSIGGCSDIKPVAGGSAHGDAAMGEKEAEGMESTIVLETWDDDPSKTATSSSVLGMLDLAQVDDEGEVTLKPSDETIQAAEQVEMDVDERADPLDAAVDATVVMKRPAGLQHDHDDGLEAIEIDGAPAAVDQDEEIVAEPAIAASDRQSSSSGDAPVQARAAPKPVAPRTSYSAAFMPPRRPRPSVDVADPVGPPSDEDELAYYLRTTGTFSSEDDLPPLSAAPSDESAAEDFLAEREVGRAVKPTSGQRTKRLAASAEAREHRLRVGEGKDGRRKGLERVVLDLQDVRLSRRVRQAIETRAAGGTAEDEERIQKEMAVQKREWRSG